MKRKLLSLILMLGAALLVACGGDSSNAEPAAVPAESSAESEANAAGAAGETGDAQTESNAAGRPKFIEFYAEW